MLNYARSIVPTKHGILVSRTGRVFNVFKSCVREAKMGNHHGYKTACNERLKRSGESRFVHRMVLEAFVGPRPEGMVAMHLNNDRADNRVENLRWGTLSENQQQMAREKRGYRSKLLTKDNVDFIRSSPLLLRELAAKFGCSETYISKIRRGKAGSHPKLI